MEKQAIARIVRGEPNWVYLLLTKTVMSNVNLPNLDWHVRRMAVAFECVYEAEDKLRARVRAKLPSTFSATLTPRIQRAIELAGEQLRENVYEICADEIALEIERHSAAERRRREQKG